MASLTPDEVMATKDVIDRHRPKSGQTWPWKTVAAALGVSPSAARNRVERVESGIYDDILQRNETRSEYEAPTLVSPHMTTDELIAHRRKRFEARRAAVQSRRWMKYKVRIDGPFCLAFNGDPHMDDNGCNWPLLERDVAIIRDNPAIWGVGLGDYTNAWAGRLQRIYAHQETTQTEAWKLAEWYFGQKKDSGQSAWWLLIKGNHDMWSASKGTGDPLDYMQRGEASLEDWHARFVAVCSNGAEVRFHAAHNFKGSSIWNPNHGPMRKAVFEPSADMYIAGDKHNWVMTQIESQEEPGRVYWACRARGYKFIDPHAEHLQFGSQHFGATIAAVVDPTAEGPTRLTCFADLEEAADYLAFKRRAI